MTTEIDISRKQEAEDYKNKANELFKNGEYNSAADMYTKAIELFESAIYYSNRSFAYLKTECFGYAFSDATKAILKGITGVHQPTWHWVNSNWL